MTTLLDGVTATEVPTDRYRAQVLQVEGDDHQGPPVVLVHGNVSSSIFFQPLMQSLPVSSYAIDLRGFGGSQSLGVDATRGLRDDSDDVAAVLDALGITRAHLVGWPMGGGIIMQLLIDRPDLVASLTLSATMSPFGVGGTLADGSLRTPDGAGTGGTGANQDFVARLAAGDTTDESPNSPRSVLATGPRASTGPASRRGPVGCSTRWPRPWWTPPGSSRRTPSRRCCGSTAART